MILTALGIAAWAGSVNASALFQEPRRGTLHEARAVRLSCKWPRCGRIADPNPTIRIVESAEAFQLPMAVLMECPFLAPSGSIAASDPTENLWRLVWREAVSQVA